MADELMLLWQQGASNEPDPAEVARLAGKAAVTKFDKKIWFRNFREYAAGAVLLMVNGYELATRGFAVRPVLVIVAVTFVMAYLWSKHRGMKPLDLAADARSYQAAMLGRLDQQIRLLSTVRYWYILPLYFSMMWQILSDAARRPLSAMGAWVIVTAMCWGIILLNERLGVRFLKAARARIESLYGDAQ